MKREPWQISYTDTAGRRITIAYVDAADRFRLTVNGEHVAGPMAGWFYSRAAAELAALEGRSVQR